MSREGGIAFWLCGDGQLSTCSASEGAALHKLFNFGVWVPQTKMGLFLELCWDALNSDCFGRASMYPNSLCAHACGAGVVCCWGL